MAAVPLLRHTTHFMIVSFTVLWHEQIEAMHNINLPYGYRWLREALRMQLNPWLHQVPVETQGSKKSLFCLSD